MDSHGTRVDGSACHCGMYRHLAMGDHSPDRRCITLIEVPSGP
uniref:Uncharacterized protein n=1 Tax=Anopheles atroparvus TaxID=41427 RepID=A0AAG5DQF5_ANOAO